MKTIKLTENGVEIECYLIPVQKENLGKVSEYLNTVSTINEGDKLEIPSHCEKCNAMYIFSRPHQCGVDLTKPKFEVWKPKEGDIVHLIDNDGIAHTGTYIDEIVKYRCFKTYKEAQEAHEKAMFNYEVEMFIKEKNEGWKPIFEPLEIADVYYLCEIYNDKSVGVHKEQNLCVRHVGKNKLFKSEQIGEEILAKFDNDKLLKYWI